MFIDIHAHAYRTKTRVPGAVNFSTGEELKERYDKMKVDCGVLLPIVNPEIYLPQSVEDILEICDTYPDRFVPYCNVDPRCLTNSPTAPLDQVLHYYKELGCKGVGEVMPNLELIDPLVQNLFACAAKEDMPIVYDGSIQKSCDFGLYDDPGLPQLEFTLQDYPTLKVFGHGPVFWNELGKLNTVAERGVFWGRKGMHIRLPSGPIEEEGTVPKLLRKYDNLYGDLSDCTAYNALARDPEFGPRFLSEFEDRMFFGTDMITPDMFVGLDELLISWRQTGKISEQTFRKVAYENAEKLLGL